MQCYTIHLIAIGLRLVVHCVGLLQQDLRPTYLIGPVGLVDPADSVLAFGSSCEWEAVTGDGPVLEFELLFLGFVGDLRLPESLPSLERTEPVLLAALEPAGLSFSWWESS